MSEHGRWVAHSDDERAAPHPGDGPAASPHPGGGRAAAPYAVEQVWPPWSEQLAAGWGRDFHDQLLGDELRMRAYRLAIREAVRPGDVVVALGTGTGVLARWALEAGAARVYGIERDPDLLARAAEAAATAGLADRFVPVPGLSFEVALPERADVIVSEILGNLVDNEDCCRILDDAVRRFLAPGGRLLPRRAERYLVPVEACEAHAQVAASTPAAGRTNPFDAYYDVILPRRGYLASPRLDRAFGFVGDPATYRSELVFAVDRPGTFTGFKGWFVADLSRTVVLDIAGDRIDGGRPGRTSSDSWKHAYLPVEHPVAVEPHDRITLSLSRSAPEGDGAPASARSYRWVGTVRRGDDVVARFGHHT
ncbi:MAG TPA: methyltransferase domain-containing protein [Acidimicrobiales bacterium]